MRTAAIAEVSNDGPGDAKEEKSQKASVDALHFKPNLDNLMGSDNEGGAESDDSD